MNPVEFHVQLSQNDTWSMSRLHFHDYFELLLPLTSSGNIFVNDQVYPLQRGSLYLISENTLHRTIANGFHSRYVLHINRKTLSELSTPQTDLLRFTREPFRCATLKDNQPEQLIELFNTLSRNENDGSYGSDLKQISSLLELLAYMASILNVSQSSETVRNKDFLRIAPILDYIQENLTESLTLDQISANFFISKHYLCRIFKSATGFSVMEYIIHNRILRARQLLQEGVSVQQAGELSGFSDNSHFIRTFGNLTGISPGRYAKEYQSGDQIRIQKG
ncbi:MAG: helix-turn-helix domain-containing protein [Oscillospiraceae bacterium]|nr:helix-turn-helix domain-containing protein [Oscillospiraceae bacterium]